MTTKQLETLANNAAPLPDGLTPDERVLYISLMDLYGRYKRNDISKNTASREKKLLIEEHNCAIIQRSAEQYHVDWAIQILGECTQLVCEYHNNPDGDAADRLMTMLTDVLFSTGVTS